MAGERAIVLGHNRLEFAEAVFGVARAGLVAVPVDARVGARTVEAIIASCQPAAIIAASADCTAVAPTTAGVRLQIAAGAPSAAWEDYDSFVATAGEANAGLSSVTASPDAPAIIMHTSGSNGVPKGVVLSHAAAMAGLRRNLPDTPDRAIRDIRQRSLLVLPLAHEAAFSALKYMLAYGGTSILAHSFRAPEFLELLAKHRCTHALLVPTMAVLLLRETARLQSLDLSAMRSIVIGSAAAPPELLRALTAAFPNAVITQNYGLTECGQVFAQSYTRAGRAPFASVGKPLRGIDVRLDGGGDLGELWVKSPTMLSGFSDSALAVGRIVDGWFRTGDLFSKDGDGYYYYRGRKDDMFTCGGMNVFPVEVENILCRHPDVIVACVIALPDEAKGQVPAAMIVLRPGTVLSPDALVAFYLDQGAAYARPRRLSFATEMPLAATGKIDRDAVRKILETEPRGADGSSSRRGDGSR